MSRAVTSPATIDPARRATLPVSPRGEVSATILDVLLRGADPASVENLGRAAAARTTDAVRDDDIQLSLFLLYALSYGTFDQLGAEHEWTPELVRLRTDLEDAFEAALREQVEVPAVPEPRVSAVADALFALTAEPGGPSLAKYVAKKASLEQVHEMLVQRSIYTLREADPHTWAIPRLTGRAKAALVEIQADEYGGGHPDRVH